MTAKCAVVRRVNIYSCLFRTFTEMSQIDSNPDLRALPCGGWKASKIGIEKSGAWNRFVDSETGAFINPTVRIDYDKKYIPPKHRSVQKLPSEITRETVVDQMFVTALHGIGGRVPLPLDLHACVGLRDEKAYARPTSARSQASVGRLQVCARASGSSPFDEADLGQTARVERGRRGDSRTKCPFRVSSSIGRRPQTARPEIPPELVITSRMG
jgi:hypothetical protein